MKKNVLLAVLIGTVSLVGVLTSLCGIGLSMGIRKLSVVSFFSVLGLLVLLRVVGSLMTPGGGRKPDC